jgi:hypothetical protein
MEKDEKIRKIAGLKQFHAPAFKAMQIDPETVQFIPRMAYKPNGHHEVVISFFASELKHGQDVYTEFVSRNYDSEDPNRILYKWNYNPFWQTEYAHSEDTIPSSIKYYIPTSELIVISKNGEINEDKSKIDIDKKDIKSTELSAMLKKNPEKPNDARKADLLDIPVKDLTLRQIIEILNSLK